MIDQSRILYGMQKRETTDMEFLPIVMAAGTGSRMTHLTLQCPKALLPVGNYPMIYYPIHMLERYGFQEVIVVVFDAYEAEIRKVLRENCGVTIKMEFVGIPHTEEWGTAETLQHIRDRIQTDILVVGCDLITDLDLNQVANVHRKHNASVTVLLSKLPESGDLPTPGQKGKSEPEKVCFGTDELEERLLMTKTVADMDEGGEALSARQLKIYPHMRIRTTFTDCHMYLMKKWVVDYLAYSKDCKKMTSIREELLPRIVKKQFPSGKRLKKSRSEWKKPVSELEQDLVDDLTSVIPNISELPDIYAFSEHAAEQKKSSDIKKLAQEMSSWYDPRGQEAVENDVIRCFTYIQSTGFCMRTNTIGTYCEANRQISKVIETLVPSIKGKGLIHPSATIKDKSQIGPDCLVAEGVVIGEKVSVKRSIIGKKCIIGDKAKIANSVIMDDVIIGESCIVMNSVIGSSASLGEKCELKDSVIGHATQLAAMSKYSNEVITDVEGSMEV